MIFFPPCKINLGLHVINKREDGFHNIETLMFQLPFTDVLEMIPSGKFSFNSTGLPIPGIPADNLCIRAFQLMQKAYDIPNVKIHLHKVIPMGGGLGGGSSDATYVLSGLNTMFELGLREAKLQELAAILGSDCPLFVKTVPQIASGRGEILVDFPLSLKGYYLKLVNIGIHVSTQIAFSNIVFQEHHESIRSLVYQPLEHWKDILKNDFEKTVFTSRTELKELKDQLYAEGAVYASMSGSGSTMFGIFKTEPVLSFGTGTFEKVILL